MNVINTYVVDITRRDALRFVANKGKIPDTLEEIAEWLLEFDQHLVRVNKAYFSLITEYAATSPISPKENPL